MDPEDADEMLSRLFERFEGIVRDREGSVEKYIGDAMVAVFGVPVIHEDDAERAVDSGIAILQELDHMKTRGEVPLEIDLRIGVHGGLITTGKRGEYKVVTGATMNITSRIQEMAEPGQMLVSAETVAQCSGDIRFDDGVRRKIRGSDGAVTVHRVLPGNRRIDADELFIGRRELLREMRNNFYQDHNSGNRGFLITGEPGIGKTGLVYRLIKEIGKDSTGSNQVLISRARRFRRVPYIVIVDFITHYFDLSRNMTEAHIVQTMCNRSRGIRISSKPLAARFAQFYRDISGQTLRDSAFEIINGVFSDFLDNAPDIGRNLLFIDNSDAMDRKSLDYLKFILSQSEPGPMVILCEREPREELAEWIPGLIHRDLPPLENNESRELIRHLIPGADDEDARHIAELSRGNPLYLRSYARYVSGDSSGKKVESHLPDNIQNLILSRIERYNPEYRDLIIKLSAFVNNFTVDDARYILLRTGENPEIAAQALQFYYREDLIDENHGMFFFRHELVKQALYDSILNYNKRILHGVIIDLMSVQDQPHPVRMLHHLVRAGRNSDAVEHLGKSRGRIYNMDYLPYLDQLEQLEGDDPVLSMDIMFMKARILFNNGFIHKAEALVTTMLGYSLAHRDRLYAAVAHHILAAQNIKEGNFERGFVSGLKALHNYSLTDEELFSLHRGLVSRSKKETMAAVIGIMVQGEIRRGNVDEAQALIAELESAENRRFHTASLIQLDIYLGDHRKARERIIEIERSEDHDPELPIRFLPYLKFLVGEWGDLEEICDEILHSEHRDAVSRVQALGFKALSLWSRDREDRRIDSLMEQAIFRSSQSPNEVDRIINCASIAELFWIMGHDSAAESNALGALVSAQRHSMTQELFSLLVILTEIHYSRSEREQALFYLEDALQMSSLGDLLKRRDRISCGYFAGILGLEGVPPVEETRALLERELEQYEAAGRELFASARYFGEIISHLL